MTSDCYVQLLLWMIHYSVCQLIFPGGFASFAVLHQLYFDVVRYCKGNITMLRKAHPEVNTSVNVIQAGLLLKIEDLDDKYADTCLVYDCPETDPLRLEANSLYDYYGIYADIGPDQNVTCVPKVGLFQLHRETANYTEAAVQCEWDGGRLARVTSAERTNHLSAVVATLGNHTRKLHLAYVGMQDSEQEGTFVTSADEPLVCFEYRGWAPGEPRSRKDAEDCVVLDSRRSWRVRDCATKLPFLCELIATVPDPCAHVKNKRFKQKCLSEVEANKGKDRKNFEKCELYDDNMEYDSEDSE